jgi:phage-related protein (TIGR01555 family)
MARKRNKNLNNQTVSNGGMTSITEPPVPRINNGMGDAIGWGNPFGGIPGYGGQNEAVSDSSTMFSNMRWYLVSNFRQLLSQAFVEIGLIQTVTTVPVDDGLRGGIMIKSKQLDEQQIKDLQIAQDRADDLGTAGWASKWERLFGGAGILILLNDQDPELPLQIEKINKNTEIEFRAVDMWELFWDKQNTEGYDSQLQAPEFEFYNYYSENLHKTRVMRLKGMVAPSFVRPRLRGWGFSVVETLVRSINQYLKATDLGFEVLDEFKLDVYKIKNLVTTLLSPNGQAQVQQRVAMANWQKNYQNAIVMDSEDDYDHKQLSFSGLAEAMEGIRRQVAADMRMPISKLFGTSENGGMNNTDQNDQENYNSMVESEVRSKLKYHLVTMLEIRCQQLFGFIPDDLEIEFKPLRELSATDQETVKTAKFERLMQAKQMNELTTLEFRDACNKGNLFDIQLDTTDSGLDSTDPELSGVAQEGGSKDPQEADTEDPDGKGANRFDKANLSLKDKIRNMIKGVKPYSESDKQKSLNSVEFDRASYMADGGDAWIDHRRKDIFESPAVSDEALWRAADAAARRTFGNGLRWQFKVWWYKKNGGKFL